MEEFIDVKDYEGLYKINRKGEIMRDGKILKNVLGTAGYYYVSLYKNGIQKNFTVHRMIALHFIDNPNNLEFIDHIDRNTTNNNIQNLRWVSPSGNSCNRSKMSNNTSGFIGINKYTTRKYIYWRVQIYKESTKLSKTFPFTEQGLEEAKQWYLSKKEMLHIFD